MEQLDLDIERLKEVKKVLKENSVVMLTPFFDSFLIDTIKQLETLKKIKTIIEENAGCNDIDTMNKIWEAINNE